MNEKTKNEVRVRMAPSPTGFLNVATVRTALFNWLFAKHNNGKFILRIEDTDSERSEKRFEEDIIDGLKWLGLEWDEFYRQTDRIDIYSRYIKQFLDKKSAFWCYHSQKELEEEGIKQEENKQTPRHICEYKHENGKDSSKKGIIRFAIDENSERKIVFNDIIRGSIEFQEKLMGDFSIAKDVNEPLYNLAAVVDDYEMDISHVIRGEDHIANTPKQILIAEALGFSNPEFTHLPIVLGEDRSKLSKRHGAVPIAEYRNLGYLPEAIVNSLVLLGWAPKNGKEIMSVGEIITDFSLDRVHKSGAIFDLKKLNWMNGQYIKSKDDLSLINLVKPFIEKYFGPQDDKLINNLYSSFRERLDFLDQVRDFHFFFKAPDVDVNILAWKKSDINGAKIALESILKLTSLDKDSLEKLAMDSFDGDRGAVYWSLRVALSGEKFSPDPLEIIKLIGEEEARKRIKKAISKV